MPEVKYTSQNIFIFFRNVLNIFSCRSPHGSLGNLHVLSDHRRKGLGSMVVRFMAKEILKTGSEVLATVVLENKSSRNMFEKMGFRPINRLYWAVVP